MKRFLSTLLVVSMLFSMFSTASATVYASGPANSPAPEDDFIFAEGPAHSPRPDDGIADDMQGDGGPADMPSGDEDDYWEPDVWVPENSPAPEDDFIFAEGPAHSPRPDDGIADDMQGDGGPADMPSGDEDDYWEPDDDFCSHGSTSDKLVDDDYEKFNSKKHSYKKYYETTCDYCEEYIGSYTETKKEYHEFDDGECEDCGYVDKNCEHDDVYKKYTYWSFYQDKNGNNKYYIEYDLICDYCDRNVGSEVSSGYEKPQYEVDDEDEKVCEHKSIKNVLRRISYMKTDEKTHSCNNEYQKVCESCDEILGEYTEKQAESHKIINNKCEDCLYVPSKNTTPAKTEKPISNSTSNKPSSSSQTTKTSKVENEKEDVVEIDEEFYGEVQSITIRPDFAYFGVNNATKTWQIVPTVKNDVLMVPLRQFSELMGWDVKWDSDTDTAIVISDDTIKFFQKGNDIFEILYREENEIRNVCLTNSLEIIDNLMYIDIDALLHGNGYSYYIRGEWYWVKKTEDVIESVAASKAFDLQELIPSADIIGSEAYRAKVAENEAMIMLAKNAEGSWYYTVMVPAAKQAVYGNFNKGEVTWEGVFAQIIVGELPGAGTAADFRDVAADFKNWEWSWAHAGNTALDMIGLIPLVGAVKYTDEIADLIKGGTKLLEPGTEAVQQALKQSDHVDDFVDVSKTAMKQADKADEAVEGATNVAQKVSKASSKILRENMIKAGVKVPDYPHAAHHIVAGNAAKAQGSREILAKFDIDINDASNGVFLPTNKNVSTSAYHPGLHTDKYYFTVFDMLSDAKTKEDALKILEDIAEQLLDGSFAY